MTTEPQVSMLLAVAVLELNDHFRKLQAEKGCGHLTLIAIEEGLVANEIDAGIERGDSAVVVSLPDLPLSLSLYLLERAADEADIEIMQYKKDFMHEFSMPSAYPWKLFAPMYWCGQLPDRIAARTHLATLLAGYFAKAHLTPQTATRLAKAFMSARVSWLSG